MDINITIDDKARRYIERRGGKVYITRKRYYISTG